mgnify:CR=1 FL=1
MRLVLVRVVYQNEGERNYHVFYLLNRGGDSAQKSKYGLRDPESFFYLNQATTQVDGVCDLCTLCCGGLANVRCTQMDDAEEFEIMENAFKYGSRLDVRLF